MRYRALVTLFLLVPSWAAAQTGPKLRPPVGGGVAFSEGNFSLPVEAGTASTTPATCVANKEVYIKTDATPGQQLFICNATGNGWVLLGGAAEVRYADQFAGATAGAKIAACIAALPSAGGTADARGLTGAQTVTATITIDKPVTLLLGAATFTASAFPAISITSPGVNLIGMGSGASIIKTADGASAHDQLVLASFTGDGLEITGVTFDHNAAGTPRILPPQSGDKRRTVEVTGGNHIRIHHNEIKNTSSVHSFLVNGSTVEDVWIRDNRWTAIGNDPGMKGSHTVGDNEATLTDSGASWTTNGLAGKIVLNLTDGSRGTITANTATTITATLTSGTDNDWDTGDLYSIQFDSSIIYVDAASNTPVLIEGNTFEATTAMDPGAFTAIETHSSNTIVRGNIIRNFHTGMNITGSESVDTRNVVVENNIMDNVVKGIMLWSAEYSSHTSGYGLDGVTVKGNHIALGAETNYAHAAGEVGIGIEDPSGVTVLDVRGLSITDNIITHPLEDVSIDHNNTYSYGIGWRSDTDKTIYDSEISRNIIINFPRGGIYLECGLVNVKIDGNTLKNTGSTLEAGLQEIIRSPLVVRAPSVVGVTIDHNVIYDDIATTRFLYPITVASSAGSDVFVRDNVFEITGTKNAHFRWVQPLVSASYDIKPTFLGIIPDVNYLTTANTKLFAQGSRVFDSSNGITFEVQADGYTWKPVGDHLGKDMVDANRMAQRLSGVEHRSGSGSDGDPFHDRGERGRQIPYRARARCARGF